MPNLLSGIKPYLALGLLCLVLYVPGMSSVPPMDRDEARYTQASRQMVETGDWVRIFFQETPRNKKPAGVYWLQAGAVKLLSDAASPEVWPYRLPSLLGGLLATLMVFYFGSFMVGREAAFVAAALLGGSLMLVTEAHLAKTDAVLLACVVATQGALSRFYMSGRGWPAPSWGTAMTFWVVMGFGILVKGPIVPMVSLFTYLTLSIADRNFRWGWKLRPLIGLMITGAVISPWFNAIYHATGGGFVNDAVGKDLIPKLMGGQERHGGWPGYYILAACLTFWPASLFMGPAVVHGWKFKADPAVRFCLAWLIPTWVLFELIPTKLPHYTLPTYPALALLVALVLTSESGRRFLEHKAAKAFALFWGVLGLAMAGAFLWLPYEYGSGSNVLALPASLGAGVAAIWGGIYFFKGDVLRAGGVALAGAVLTFVFAFQGVMPALDDLWLSEQTRAAVERYGTTYPVAAAEYHEPSLVFLLGTKTYLTDGAGAAGHILSKPGAIAVVGGREEEKFQAAVTASKGKVTLLETLEGFNYSRGRRTTLRLYTTDAYDGPLRIAPGG